MTTKAFKNIREMFAAQVNVAKIALTNAQPISNYPRNDNALVIEVIEALNSELKAVDLILTVSKRGANHSDWELGLARVGASDSRVTAGNIEFMTNTPEYHGYKRHGQDKAERMPYLGGAIAERAPLALGLQRLISDVVETQVLFFPQTLKKDEPAPTEP